MNHIEIYTAPRLEITDPEILRFLDPKGEMLPTFVKCGLVKPKKDAVGSYDDVVVVGKILKIRSNDPDARWEWSNSGN